VDFFVRLFTQLKFGVVQTCILLAVLGVPGCQQFLTLLSCLENRRHDLVKSYLLTIQLKFLVIVKGHNRKTLRERYLYSGW